jgi:hypothetical protein
LFCFWVFFLYRLVCQISTKRTQFGVHPVVVKERGPSSFSAQGVGKKEQSYGFGEEFFIFYLFYFFPLGIEPHFVNFSLIILFFLIGPQFV